MPLPGALQVKGRATAAKAAASLSLHARQHPVSCATTITVHSALGNSDKLVAAGLSHPETVRIITAALQSLLEDMRAAGATEVGDFWVFKVVPLPGSKPGSALHESFTIHLSPATGSSSATPSYPASVGPRTTKFDPDRGNPGWFAATWSQLPDDSGAPAPGPTSQILWRWYIRKTGDGEHKVEQGKEALVATFEEYDTFPPPRESTVQDHIVVRLEGSS